MRGSPARSVSGENCQSPERRIRLEGLAVVKSRQAATGSAPPLLTGRNCTHAARLSDDVVPRFCRPAVTPPKTPANPAKPNVYLPLFPSVCLSGLHQIFLITPRES